MIKMTIQDAEETAEFKVLEKPIIQKPLIAESDVVTIDNNLSTYVTGTQKRELTVGLGYLDSVGYETLRRIRDRQYAVLKYPTVTITADEPVDLGYGEDVPDYRQRLVQLKGKNLLDSSSENITQRFNCVTENVDNGIKVNGTSTGNSHYATLNIVDIERLLGQEVTVTCNYAGSALSRVAVYYIRSGGQAWAYITELTDNNGVASKTFTMPNSLGEYIGIGLVLYTGASESSTFTNLQLEKGPTATAYEPYTNIELCKIGTYQDYIYKSGDKWYVHKEVLKYQLTGSESYMARTNTSTTHGKYRITNAVLASDIAGAAALSCSHFIANIGANEAAYSENAICGSSQSGYQKMLWFSIANSIVASLDAFKTWVANNRPIVYYAIATPTETEIANDTLKAQLEALTESAFDRWTRVQTEAQDSNLTPNITVSQGTLSETGTDVMLDGTTEDLLDFVIFGDTFQQTYSGKNKLNPNDVQSIFLYSNADRAAWSSGNKGVCIRVEQNTIYTVSTTISQARYRVAVCDSTPVQGGGDVACYNGSNKDGTSSSITINSGSHTYMIVNATDVAKIQVEKSSQATSFEPYVGGVPSPNPDYPQEVRTVNGNINFDFSGPSGVKKYTMVGKMTLAEQRIIDNCGTNEQVQVSFRESKQI